MNQISLPDIVFQFFELCRLQPLEIRKGIWQVQIDDILIKELDGWRAKGRLLQFTFDKKLAETYGAELIGPGSYRINSILQVIRKQAALSHAHMPHSVFHEPNIRKKVIQRLSEKTAATRVYVLNNSLLYGQYLWMVMSLSFVTHEKKEEIKTPLVNLRSGKVLSFALPTHLFCSGVPVSENIGKRKVSFKQAYAKICDHLVEEISRMDDTWAKEAWDHVRQEQAKLEAYFEDNTVQDNQAAKKVELLNRTAPKVQIRALRGAILYVPLFQYRLMEVMDTGKERIRNIHYDPVSNRLEEL